MTGKKIPLVNTDMRLNVGHSILGGEIDHNDSSLIPLPFRSGLQGEVNLQSAEEL